MTRETDTQRFRAALGSRSARQGWFERSLRLVIRAWCWAVGWRLEVGPMTDLPARTTSAPGSGCLVAGAPHRAWVEPFLLMAAWPADAAPLVWLADGRTVTGSWWRSRFLPKVGVIPIEGSVRALHGYAEMAAQVLAAGAAVVVFPETGPASEPGRLRTISPGFAYLARRAGAPIVPVVFGGTHAIMRGSTFSVDALEWIDVGPADREPFSPESRRLAHELTERYTATIAAALPERNALTAARRPDRERWRWLATLFD